MISVFAAAWTCPQHPDVVVPHDRTLAVHRAPRCPSCDRFLKLHTRDAPDSAWAQVR